MADDAKTGGGGKVAFAPGANVSGDPRQIANALIESYKQWMEANASLADMMWNGWRTILFGPSKSATSSVGSDAYVAGKHFFLFALNNASIGNEAAREQIVDALFDDPRFAQWVRSDSRHVMRTMGTWFAAVYGADPLFNEMQAAKSDKANTLSSGLVTHKPDGSLEKAEPAHIRAMFPEGKQAEWPQLFLTTGHALSRNRMDVGNIMRGFHYFARDAFDGTELDLQRPITGGKANLSKKTAVVAAVDTNKNALLNGANLLDRLEMLSRRGSKSKIEIDPLYHDHISPASIRLAKLIIRLMVRDQDQQFIKLDSEHLIAEDSPGKTLYLRPDAASVAQHITLMGYSKGGNVVSDAVRRVVVELSQQNRGRPVFWPLHDQEVGSDTGMDRWDIQKIVKNMTLISVAARELPLTDDEKQHGMRRLNLVNKEDLIAGHFNIRMQDQYGQHDDLIVVDGKKRRAGHDPIDALGWKLNGRAVKGYMIGDERVYDRMRTLVAPSYGRAAIADIQFVPADHDHPRRLVLELAPGTSEAKWAEKRPAVVKALSEALKDYGEVEITEEPGAYEWREWGITLKPKGQVNGASADRLMDDPKILAKMREVFTTWAKAEKGIIVSQTVAKAIDQRIEAIGHGAGGARGATDGTEGKKDIASLPDYDASGPFGHDGVLYERAETRLI